jgi:hypothetical protein
MPRIIVKYSSGLLILLYLSICSFYAAAQTKPSPGGSGKYKNLVWKDKFNKTGLPDASKWNYDTGFIANHEIQYYTSGRKENARVFNGLLDITALNDSLVVNGVMQPITSARIKTQGKQSWTAASFFRLRGRAPPRLPFLRAQRPKIEPVRARL